MSPEASVPTPANPREQAINAQLSVNDALANQLSAVPVSAEAADQQLAKLGEMRQAVANGAVPDGVEFSADDPTTVDLLAQTDEFLEKGLGNWTVDDDQRTALQTVLNAKFPGDLPEDLRRGLPKDSKLGLQSAQDKARTKLSLSDEITSRQQAREEQAAAARRGRAKTNAADYHDWRREKLAAKMDAEKTRVAGEASEAALAEAMAGIDVKVYAAMDHKRIRWNAKDLEAGYRKQFEDEAQEAALAAGERAAAEREAYINANGGAAAIEHIRGQEADEAAAKQKAADTEAFQRRMLGDRAYEAAQAAKRAVGNPGEVHITDNRDASKQLERPAGVSYKDWLNADPSERSKLVEQAVIDPATDPDVDQVAQERGMREREDVINFLVAQGVDPKEAERLAQDNAVEELEDYLLQPGTVGPMSPPSWGNYLDDPRLTPPRPGGSRAANRDPIPTTPKGLKARMGHALGRAYYGVLNLAHDKLNTRKRRGIAAGVAGAIAVGSYLLFSRHTGQMPSGGGGGYDALSSSGGGGSTTHDTLKSTLVTSGTGTTTHETVTTTVTSAGGATGTTPEAVSTTPGSAPGANANTVDSSAHSHPRTHTGPQPRGESQTGTPPPEALNFDMNAGTPYQALHEAGIPNSQIMSSLDSAAKQAQQHHDIAGFRWHGSGSHRWLELITKAGKKLSGTRSVLTTIGNYIHR